jgi:hypothetical protein
MGRLGSRRRLPPKFQALGQAGECSATAFVGSRPGRISGICRQFPRIHLIAKLSRVQHPRVWREGLGGSGVGISGRHSIAERLDIAAAQVRFLDAERRMSGNRP